MKKLIALLLALVMVFALVACGNPGSEQTGDPNPSTSTNPGTDGPKTDAKGRYPAETVKIGFVNYDTTAEQVLIFQNYIDYLDDYFNIEFMWSESLSDASGEIAFIENCAAAGCDAIFGYYNVCNEEAVKRATELGMYYWGQGGNPAITESQAMNPNYLGSFYTGNADYEYGKACAEILIEAGCEKLIMVSGGKALGVDMFIKRYNGAMDAIAAAQAAGKNVEVVYEVAGFPGNDEFTAQQAQALATDADGLISLLTALMWIQPMQESGKFGQIKVAAVDTLSEGSVGMFGAGMYAGTATEIIDVFGMCVPMIINAVEGYGAQQRNADGSAPMVNCSFWKVTNIEDAGYFASVQGGEKGDSWVWDYEDIQSLLYAYNPDLTIEDMSAMYCAVSSAEIQARRAD